MDANVYKVELFFAGNEDDAKSLRKHLAQSISNEFDLPKVFGVIIALDEQKTERLERSD